MMMMIRASGVVMRMKDGTQNVIYWQTMTLWNTHIVRTAERRFYVRSDIWMKKIIATVIIITTHTNISIA